MYSSAHRLVAGVVVAAVALISSGCGDSTGVVSGKITIAGKPLKSGLITFLSDAGNKDPFSAAIIDGEYRTGPIPCGPTKIMIVPRNESSQNAQTGAGNGPDVLPSARYTPTTFVPARYQNPETSSLTLTVEKGENPFSVDLTR